jgi:arylsulfatase A-like enzyme
MAIAFGLCAGYLDLGIMLFKKLCLHSEGYIRSARDFAWTVPLGHVVLVGTPGVLMALVNAFRPVGISLRTAAWFFATLAIWGPFLRMPMYGVCTLLMAAGVGRLVSDAIVSRGLSSRSLRHALAALLGVLGVLAAATTGRQAVAEFNTVANLAPPPSNARNVVLIVWDTVRAQSLSLYGYSRDTTPNLTEWARRGVVYDRAIAPAPWTYPSHSSFFTGLWPFQLNSQWKFKLDSQIPTLAEHLAGQGYQTAGFAANTNCCSYEGGLARGFAHFEDYPLSPRSLLSRTFPGKWLLENLVGRWDFYDKKWISLQSRGAREIDDAFLGWLRQRRPDRPFFAFLNHFDAHEPFMPPAEYVGRFGIKPRNRRDYEYVYDFVGAMNRQLRDVYMAHDCYDDCIAYLDQELDRLLRELDGQGILENTVVIITSDHGEAFGEHGSFGHSYSAFVEELAVPLVILSPGAPAGRLIASPVSLRDLPATVVDLLGLSAGSPFPGRSLANCWNLPPGGTSREITSPALSEQAVANAFDIQTASIPEISPFRMSLMTSGHHYIRDGKGVEWLFNVAIDPYERFDLMATPDGENFVASFRRKLSDVLTENPGSAKVEGVYLEQYKQSLKSIVATADRESVNHDP